jgi:L-alanine-DL-glutamate epimerase-like enolase superfamily enzyme
LNGRFRIRSARAVRVRWRLRRPFVTALGRKTLSDNAVVRVTLEGGESGYGEASSSLASPSQTGPRLCAALSRLAGRFRGADVRDLPRLVDAVWRVEAGVPAAASAFETALWDALARSLGVPFHRMWGGATRELRTTLTVSAVSPDQAFESAREAYRRGFRHLKVKLNARDGAETDRQRVREVRRAAPRARLLLDANQSHTPVSLRLLLASLHGDGIETELVEEPFLKRDWSALARFRGMSRLPVLLDESVQTPEDAALVRRRGLAAGVNVKLAKSGLSRGLRIVDAFRAERGRSPLMVGCMAESPLGLAASVQWACGLGAFDWVDLDSDLLLRPPLPPGGYVRRGPVVTLPRRERPGLGVDWTGV